MQLRDYLHFSRLTQAEFAKKLTPPVSQGKVNHWLHGARRVSLVEALQIERITGGQVTVAELALLGCQKPPKTPANIAQTATQTIAHGV